MGDLLTVVRMRNQNEALPEGHIAHQASNGWEEETRQCPMIATVVQTAGCRGRQKRRKR